MTQIELMLRQAARSRARRRRESAADMRLAMLSCWTHDAAPAFDELIDRLSEIADT